MEPYLAEIRMFGGNFAPHRWALCQGQLLPIAQNQALYSLLGTSFGGDGRTTFALPDLRGRVPIGMGQAPGLTNRSLGEKVGNYIYNLNAGQLPPHSHTAENATFYPLGIDEKDNSASPANTHPSKTTNAGNQLYRVAPNTTMATQTVQFAALPSGEGQSINNYQPNIGIQFIICISGLFPSRS